MVATPAVALRKIALVCLLLGVTPTAADAAEPVRFELSWPTVRLWVGAEGVSGVEVRAVDGSGATVADYADSLRLSGLGDTSSVAMAGGVATLDGVSITAATVTVAGRRVSSDVAVPTLDGLWSLLPAVFAIGLALITRQVLLSLLGGVWLGAAFLFGSPLEAFPRALDMLVTVAADADRMKIIVFTLGMGGMVGVMTASGGTAGIVDLVSGLAKSSRSASIATWGVGLLVFFDDYASSLLVGSTMRPITDKFRISREKLAYLVDSTAAPIASIALISTWVGYEVSLLADAMASAGIERDAYDVFIKGIPSRFYQVFALAFVFIIAWMGRDFGPMLSAERRARHEGKPIRDGGKPLMETGLMDEAEALGSVTPRWWLALGPIAALVSTVLVVLWVTGSASGAADATAFAQAKDAGVVRLMGYVLSNAASYDALLYGSGVGAGLAMIGALATRSTNLTGTVDAFVRGVRAMSLAVMVLVLAWSIGKVIDDLRAGPYVAGLIADTLPVWSIPSLTFLLGAVIAVSTGTSWGTMAILFPIVLPVVATHAGTPDFDSLLLGSTSAILGGAVFGDHCSPISDTTVLSSIASGSDHVDHTRTQAPYALVCAAIAVALGYLPVGMGLSPWISLIVGLAALVAIARFAGKRPEDPPH